MASSIGLTYIVNGLVMNTFVRHFGEYKTFLMPACTSSPPSYPHYEPCSGRGKEDALMM